MKFRPLHALARSWPHPPRGLIWLLLAGIAVMHLIFSLVIMPALRQQATGTAPPESDRLSRLTLTLMFYPVLYGDASRYVQDRDKYREIAQTLDSGGEFATTPDSHTTLRRMPGYPLFLFLVQRVGGDGVRLLALVQLALVLIACYWCYRMAGGPERYDGLAAAAILGGYPLILVYVPRYYSEVLTVFLITGALYCLHVFLRGGRVIGLWGFFIVAAGAWLCRASIAVWLLPLLVLLIIEARRRGRLAAFGIGLLLMAGVMSPWLIHNAAQTGELVWGSTWNARSALHGLHTVTHPWAERAHGELDQLYQYLTGEWLADRVGKVDSARQELRENRAAVRLYLETVTRRPDEVLLSWFRGFFRAYFQTSTPLMRAAMAAVNLLLAALILLGFGRRSTGTDAAFERACWLLLVSFYLFHSLVYPAVRYLLPALPALALLAAPGATSLLDRLRGNIDARE
jgi:4-amino-4-deoxy-L-arabinose transferase-like glycosyltransferase